VRLSIQKLYLALNEAFKKLPIHDISEGFKSGGDHCSLSIISEEFTVRMQALLSYRCTMRRAPRISLNDDDDDDDGNDAILTCARKLYIS